MFTLSQKLAALSSRLGDPCCHSCLKEEGAPLACIQVEWGTHPEQLHFHATGNRTSYVSDYPNALYVSGIFHHVKLEGLAPEVTYFYRQATVRCSQTTRPVHCGVSVVCRQHGDKLCCETEELVTLTLCPACMRKVVSASVPVAWSV